VPITNEFRIKLNSQKKLGQEEKEQALEIVKKMMQQGYPNLFGDQRFGINGRNATQ
jgi:tRNA(Glu) U13 pseudouridine synthase TruD